MAPYLSSQFENENFRFYSQELRGVKEMQPRWKRVVTAIDGQMGEALGKLYVEKHFPPAAKQRMDELVKNLMEAYRERIESRDWMGPKTKKLALAKLAAVHAENRLPEQMARLFRPGNPRRLLRRKRHARRSIRVALLVQQDRPSRRSHRMAHDAADRQRLLQPDA